MRNGAAVPADQQSVIPAVRGVPWWAAVVIAVAITAIGAAIDADARGALGTSFKACYLIGCLLAALAVRRRAMFTAAAQPPLVAFFVGIITLYTLNRDEAEGLRSVVLKVVLPIATSFPWILLTFLLTLLVVVARWYFSRRAVNAQHAAENAVSATAKKSGKARTRTSSAKSGAAAKSGGRPARRDQDGDRAARTVKTGAVGAGAGETRTRRSTGTATAEKPRRQASGRQKTAADEKPVEKTPAGKSPSPKNSAAKPAAQKTATPKNSAPKTPSAQKSTAPKSAPVSPEKRGPAGAEAAAGSASSSVRKARTAVGESQARPARRAQPQTVPPRQPAGRPARTAGQRLREQGAIEDLTLGVDDLESGSPS